MTVAVTGPGIQEEVSDRRISKHVPERKLVNMIDRDPLDDGVLHDVNGMGRLETPKTGDEMTSRDSTNLLGAYLFPKSILHLSA